MRIGLISDLHLTTDTAVLYLEQLMDYYNSNNLHLLLIAGDISEDVNTTIEFVSKLAKVINVKYVPGNHDLWNRYNKLETTEIYERYLQDENCVLNKLIPLTENYDLVGHIGWYDYSLGDSTKFLPTTFDSLTIDGRSWNDINYVNFKQSNQHLCHQFNGQIEQLLTSNSKRKILLTHMISNPGFKTYFDETRKNVDFFNAFLGSTGLYELTKLPQVSFAVCGHVHYRKTIKMNQTNYICPCLGNQNEWINYSSDIDLKSQLNNCIEIIEID